MVTVTCNGCFDGLHSGHMFFLGYCAAHGDRLIVGVNDDAYIRRHKRTHPFCSETQRREQLMRLCVVHEVRIFAESDPSAFIRDIRPDVHCISEEYRERAPELLVCQELGVRTVFVPRVGAWSTSGNHSTSDAHLPLPRT